MEIDEDYCEGAILVHQSAEECVFGAPRMHCQLKNNWCKISVPAGTFINLVPVHPPYQLILTIQHLPAKHFPLKIVPQCLVNLC